MELCGKPPVCGLDLCVEIVRINAKIYINLQISHKIRNGGNIVYSTCGSNLRRLENLGGSLYESEGRVFESPRAHQ
jgi:hypothetical protein